jgi:hypothetical protein
VPCRLVAAVAAAAATPVPLSALTLAAVLTLPAGGVAAAGCFHGLIVGEAAAGLGLGLVLGLGDGNGDGDLLLVAPLAVLLLAVPLPAPTVAGMLPGFATGSAWVAAGLPWCLPSAALLRLCRTCSAAISAAASSDASPEPWALEPLASSSATACCPCSETLLRVLLLAL